MKIGDRIRITKWAVNPEYQAIPEYDENVRIPLPVEGVVDDVAEGIARSMFGQLFHVKFDNGHSLWVLKDDEWEAV